MAAVWCFVFLFAFAASVLLLQVFTPVANIVFIALAAGVFVGMYKLAKGWEAEAGPEH